MVLRKLCSAHVLLYGIEALPFTRQLKVQIPTVIQLWWYADDVGAAGKFEEIRKQYSRLWQELGPQYGYFPGPTKSILIVSDDKNLEWICESDLGRESFFKSKEGS
uniref:Uncharacterized protein n=1 Tax=Grammatophora oceanica TaxID=210454 RepID=A0A7S1Y1Y6_9STRA|mmetsp:Transcript_19398/g.28711  ORF Transcript_19398/g.28711 Transcript_19398/m.28711 type:complete len:106 (+) Transcript_19398:125-442(+)